MRSYFKTNLVDSQVLCQWEVSDVHYMHFSFPRKSWTARHRAIRQTFLVQIPENVKIREKILWDSTIDFSIRYKVHEVLLLGKFSRVHRSCHDNICYSSHQLHYHTANRAESSPPKLDWSSSASECQLRSHTACGGLDRVVAPNFRLESSLWSSCSCKERKLRCWICVNCESLSCNKATHNRK